MPESDAWNDFQILPLTSKHERRAFSCGEPELDAFLQKYAAQNEKKDLTRTYVLGEKRAPAVVVGFSSVRFGQVSFETLPEDEQRGLPRYPVPTFHIARFAIDNRFQGKRLGELLLLSVFRLASDSADQAGLFAIEVVAKTERAKIFYMKYGFQALLDDALHLYLSMRIVRGALAP